MHVVAFEKIPLPAFSTYIIFTLTSLFISIFHLLATHDDDDLSQSNNRTKSFINTYNFSERCIMDSWCFWSCVNFTYSCLLIFGLLIQSTFFGELRPDEQSNIREKFWNFLFYKLVFIFGVLNIKSMDGLIGWSAWSSVVGFLHLLIGLTKDRLSFITQIQQSHPLVHVKMFVLILGMYFAGNILLLTTIYAGLNSFNIMFFMFAEVLILFASIIEITSLYGVYFYMELEASKETGHPKCYQTLINHYVEMVFSFLINFFEFVHNIHMLSCNVSMINISNLVIFMHLQYIYFDSHNCYLRHCEYQGIFDTLKASFKMIHLPNVNCPICWDPLKRDSLRLNCGHEFHFPCLIQWMQRNRNCPTCRKNILLEERSDEIPQANSTQIYLSNQSELRGGISKKEPNSEHKDDQSDLPSHEILTSDLLLLDGLLGNNNRYHQILSTINTPNLRLDNLSHTIDTAMKENRKEILVRLHSFSSRMKEEIESHLAAFNHDPLENGFDDNF